MDCSVTFASSAGPLIGLAAIIFAFFAGYAMILWAYGQASRRR